MGMKPGTFNYFIKNCMSLDHASSFVAVGDTNLQSSTLLNHPFSSLVRVGSFIPQSTRSAGNGYQRNSTVALHMTIHAVAPPIHCSARIVPTTKDKTETRRDDVIW